MTWFACTCTSTFIQTCSASELIRLSHSAAIENTHLFRNCFVWWWGGNDAVLRYRTRKLCHDVSDVFRWLSVVITNNDIVCDWICDETSRRRWTYDNLFFFFYINERFTRKQTIRSNKGAHSHRKSEYAIDTLYIFHWILLLSKLCAYFASPFAWEFYLCEKFTSIN